MAQARLSKRCKLCGARFQTKSPTERYCAAHRQKPQPVAVAPGSSATSWVPYAKLKLADRVEQWLFAHDAANECEHGALPHDKVLPKGCGCWGERVPFVEKPAPKKRAKAKKAA